MNLTEKRQIYQFDLDFMIDYKMLFGNDNPVHLEIGSGRGEFLFGTAIENPNVNFIGVDSKEKRIKTIIRKMNPEQHANIRLTKNLINEKSIQFFPEKSIEKIYLIHPDPWPKRKHFKRRILQAGFIDILARLLKQNGVIEISTDHQEYAMWIVERFKKRDDLSSAYKGGFSLERPEGYYETFFEKKKKAEGFPPYFMKYKLN